MTTVNGLVVMTPTSIASAGSGNSSSINADGSVDFASCTRISLNGVFTSSYDNYMVVVRFSSSGNEDVFGARLRSSGTDNAAASSYTFRMVQASGTSKSPSDTSTDIAYAFYVDNDIQSNGNILFLWRPNLAQPTGGRVVNQDSFSSARLTDIAWTHNQSVSYDGISFISLNNALSSGTLTVFGFNQ